MSAHRLEQLLAEKSSATNQRVSTPMPAQVVSHDGTTVTVTIAYFDGGIEQQDILFTQDPPLSPGDEVLVLQDILDRYWVISHA